MGLTFTSMTISPTKCPFPHTYSSHTGLFTALQNKQTENPKTPNQKNNTGKPLPQSLWNILLLDNCTAHFLTWFKNHILYGRCLWCLSEPYKGRIYMCSLIYPHSEAEGCWRTVVLSTHYIRWNSVLAQSVKMWPCCSINEDSGLCLASPGKSQVTGHTSPCFHITSSESSSHAVLSSVWRKQI